MSKHPFLKTFYLYLIPFLFSLTAYSQNENLVEKTSYIEDALNKVNISSLDSLTFEPIANRVLGVSKNIFWFKVQLKKTKANQPIVFQIKESSIDFIEIYDSKKRITSHKNTTENPNISVEISHTAAIYYFKIAFQKQVYFNLKVLQKEQFLEQQNIQLFKFGLFYGLVIMVFIINLLFYFSLKDTIFLWYCFFLLSINLGISTYDGVLNSIITDTQNLRFIIGVIYLLIPISCAIFSIKFLQLDLYWKKVKFYAIALLIAEAILTIIYFITDDFTYLAYGDNIALIIFLASWILGILVIKKQPFAKFYVVGYSVILFTSILYTITVNFGFQSFTVTLDHMKIGTVLELFILTYAITYRVKTLKEQNAQMSFEIQQYFTQINHLEKSLNISNTEKSITSDEKIEAIAKKHALTDRETSVLILLIGGHNNKAIAEKLVVSVNTIKYHTRNIYEKLDIKKRTEIVSKIT